MADNFNAESLWEFVSWGVSDAVGGAYMYNVGNGSEWRMDLMDGGAGSIPGVTPELVPFNDTARLQQHWTVRSYSTFAASDRSSFSAIPTSATALLAQYANAVSTITPYTAGTVTATGSSRSSASATSTASSGAAAQSASVSHSGLSTGGAIGLGVGIGVAVLVIAALVIALLFYRRRKRELGAKRNPAEVQGGLPQTPIQTKPEARAPPNSAAFVELESPIAAKKPLYQSEPHRSEMSDYSQSSRVELEDNSMRIGTYTHNTAPSPQWDENSTMYGGSGSRVSTLDKHVHQGLESSNSS